MGIPKISAPSAQIHGACLKNYPTPQAIPGVKHLEKIYSVWRVQYIYEYLSQKRILMLCVIHKSEREIVNRLIVLIIHNYEVGIRTLPSFTSKFVLVHDMVPWDG
jgi:hypothetical protein